MSIYTDSLLKLVVMSDIHLLPKGEVKRDLDTAPRFMKAIQSSGLFIASCLAFFIFSISLKPVLQKPSTISLLSDICFSGLSANEPSPLTLFPVILYFARSRLRFSNG